MRSLIPTSLFALLFASVCCGDNLADTAGSLRQRHPWGRFEPGAWKLVRVVTETLNERGEVVSTSTTESKTTLKKVEDSGVTLLVEVVVEIGGRRLDAEPQTIKQSFSGEQPGHVVKTSDGGPALVTIEGQEYPCRVEQTESTGGNTKTVTRTYYSATTAPYALKLESVTTDVHTGARVSETESQVSSVGIPSRVLRDVKIAAHVRSVYKHPKGSTTTLAVTSSDIPGGIVCHNARESDGNGRLIRRSTLELVAFGTEPDEGRGGFLRRGRSPHRNRLSPYRSLPR